MLHYDSSCLIPQLGVCHESVYINLGRLEHNSFHILLLLPQTVNTRVNTRVRRDLLIVDSILNMYNMNRARANVTSNLLGNPVYSGTVPFEAGVIAILDRLQWDMLS